MSLLFSRAFYQLGTEFYTEVKPTPLKKPHWIHINKALGLELGFDYSEWANPDLLSIFNGEKKLADEPQLAMVYAGHQFGGYSPQLGDGRALLIAQIETGKELHDIQLKGAGKTPFSRFGDGRAVLRSSLREYLCSEAMYGLGIPTSRALCLVGSLEPVMREQLETGAIVARVARSHIRFGHFEFFFYTQQYDQLKTLADHVITHYLPDAPKGKEKYAYLLQYTITRTATLIAQWQAVGFAHGVMNTDNMSVLGETLDYGPFGFMDDYNPGFICNHSDHTGRYAFDEQPSIGLWNLNALAHALSPLIDQQTISESLQMYEPTIVEHYASLMRQKLGLQQQRDEDQSIVSQLLTLLARNQVDYSYFFRQLCDFHNNQPTDNLNELFTQQQEWQDWCYRYQQRLQNENSHDATRQQYMKQINPKFIPRNYLLQQAIDQAQQQNYGEIERLFTLFSAPYAEHPDMDKYALPTPSWGKQISVSCSS